MDTTKGQIRDPHFDGRLRRFVYIFGIWNAHVVLPQAEYRPAIMQHNHYYYFNRHKSQATGFSLIYQLRTSVYKCSRLGECWNGWYQKSKSLHSYTYEADTLPLL